MVLHSEMLSPLPGKFWNRILAAHLLNRAGFGGTPAEIEKLASLGVEKAVESFFQADDDGDLFPLPSLMEPAVRFDDHQRLQGAKTEEEKQGLRKNSMRLNAPKCSICVSGG